MEPRNSARLLILLAVVGSTRGITPSAQSRTEIAGTITGRLIVERPTLLSLGFEWMISGDENRNAAVGVEYRKEGEVAWRGALPLLRLQPEGPDNIESGAASGRHAGLVRYEVPNAFAGSVLNLEPDTPYEVRFTLSDPDGVTGERVKTARVRTRPEPTPAAGGSVYHVYPNYYTGQKQEPSFIGLLRAYYAGLTNGDRNNSFPPRVKPGDIILVHAGIYKEGNERNLYNGNSSRPIFYGLEFDGTYYLRQSGTAEKPIVIKAAGDGEVVFDGDGVAVLFDLTAASYTYFEGITFRNVGTAIQTGRKGEAGGASGLTVKRCRIENVGRGIFGDWAGSKDFYIADNVFVGRHAPDHMLGWSAAKWSSVPGFPAPINGPDGSELGVKVYGQGHVVAYNRIVNFHDGIDHATYGAPDGAPDAVVEENVPGSIDFYGNDMDNFGDNCFEVDGGARNMRVFRNRCFNSASDGLSAEPIFGGPVYAYQNLLYNAGTVKGGSGALIYQNTMVGQLRPAGDQYPSNLHLRNNLLIGLGTSAELLRVITDHSSTSDYNGFALNPGGRNFVWVDLSTQPLPPAARPAAGAPAPTVPGFTTLSEYSKATGQDGHSLVIDYGVFVNASGPDHTDITRLYKPERLDFRLKAGSRAVNAGVLLPTINDDFAGSAPDLGAYETERAIPHYGPRPVVGDRKGSSAAAR